MNWLSMGFVQLVDARGSWEKMRKSLGEKRKRISDDQIAGIVRTSTACSRRASA